MAMSKWHEKATWWAVLLVGCALGAIGMLTVFVLTGQPAP